MAHALSERGYPATWLGRLRLPGLGWESGRSPGRLVAACALSDVCMSDRIDGGSRTEGDPFWSVRCTHEFVEVSISSLRVVVPPLARACSSPNLLRFLLCRRPCIAFVCVVNTIHASDNIKAVRY